MAAGRVITGFSKPYVALYTEEGGVVTYSDGRVLARGVSVELSITTGGENPFYADNGQAESAGGAFTGGTATLVVDGLQPESETLVLGLPEATPVTVGENQVDVQDYGEAVRIPYVGVGFIVRYVSGGVISYVATVLTKAKFNTPTETAETEGEDGVTYQTQTLTAALMRDDTAKKNWKRVSAPLPTEAEAEAVIRTILNIQEGA